MIVLPGFSVLGASCSVGRMEGALTRPIGPVATTKHKHLGSAPADLPTILAYLARARIQTDLSRALLETLGLDQGSLLLVRRAWVELAVGGRRSVACACRRARRANPPVCLVPTAGACTGIVFGIIKRVARAEWSLVAMAWNIKRLPVLRAT